MTREYRLGCRLISQGARLLSVTIRSRRRRRTVTRSVHRYLSALLIGGGALVVSPSFAQTDAPSERNLSAGMRIYHQKADCQACHGWAGDGRKMNNQMPDGANLRISELDRDQVIFVIKCGLPGRSMPAFDRLAYEDDRCLGRTRADLRRMGLGLFDPAATLQQREVERLTDFLFAKVIGQGPMDRAACIQFWGSDVDACGELPQ